MTLYVEYFKGRMLALSFRDENQFHDDYEGREGWYWRLVAGNGRKVAIGGEGFKTKANARRSFNQLRIRAAERKE